MANKCVHKIPINKAYVKNVIKKHGYSIRSLCADPGLDLSDKTVYRALNNGVMSSRTVYIIEEFLNDYITKDREFGMYIKLSDRELTDAEINFGNAVKQLSEDIHKVFGKYGEEVEFRVFAYYCEEWLGIKKPIRRKEN